MLADERAKSLVEDFAFQWLDVAKLDEIVPDRGQFPQASGLLDPRELMKEELRLVRRQRVPRRSQRRRAADRRLHLS